MSQNQQKERQRKKYSSSEQTPCDKIIKALFTPVKPAPAGGPKVKKSFFSTSPILKRPKETKTSKLTPGTRESKKVSPNMIFRGMFNYPQEQQQHQQQRQSSCAAADYASDSSTISSGSITSLNEGRKLNGVKIIWGDDESCVAFVLSFS